MPTVTKDVKIVLSGAEPVLSWEVYRDEIYSDIGEKPKNYKPKVKSFNIDDLPDLRTVDSLFFS